MDEKSINWCGPLQRGGLLAAALVAGEVMSGGASAAVPVATAVRVPGAVVLAQAQSDAAAPFDELNAALEAARAKLDQLTDAAKVAALAQNLRDQLDAATGENGRLRAQMQELREAHEQAQAQIAAAADDLAERAKEIRALQGRDQERAEAARQQAARIQDLEGSLEAAEQQLADMQEVVEGALGEAAELGRSVAEARQELGAAKEEAERLRAERDEARQQLVSFRERSEQLDQQLADARRQLNARNDDNDALRQQVAELQDAAQAARDAARQNLLAVEDKIKLLNEALAGIGAMAPDQPGPRATDPKPTPVMPLPPAAIPSASNELSPIRAANATEGAELRSMQIQPAVATHKRPDALLAAAGDLPLEQRVQAQSLLADLKAQTRDGGLLMQVPGEDLFRLDSEQIEPTAHDALVKVAELISLYEGHEVEIVGHTDAMGDASYNQHLSERRAELVRDFFVENFDIEAARLKVKGLGEREPIATNTTQAGRRANRRLEVIIRN